MGQYMFIVDRPKEKKKDNIQTQTYYKLHYISIVDEKCRA